MAPRKKRSLLSWAFGNQYNMILLGAAGVFALATFSWIPLLIGAGVETLWLTIGADTTPFKRWVNLQEGAAERADLEAKAKSALEILGPRYVQRFQELSALGEEIQQLGVDNPSLENDLIQGEMAKLGGLLNTFLQMAVAHQRLGEYLAENGETDIQRDINQCEKSISVEKNRDVAASLRQALALAQKRMKQHETIESNFKLLTVKMDTMEKAFRYLKSRIVAINKGEQLTEEIDNLVLGVESVEELSADTSTLLDEARGKAAARQGIKS